MVNIPLVDVNLDIHGTTALAPQAPPALLPAEIMAKLLLVSHINPMTLFYLMDSIRHLEEEIAPTGLLVAIPILMQYYA